MNIPSLAELIGGSLILVLIFIIFRFIRFMAPILDIYREAKTSIEFIRKYKGKRIRIRESSFTSAEDRSSRQFISYIIEGKVEDTTAYPPGFKLLDVKEFVQIGTLTPDSLDFDWKQGQREEIDEQTIREVGEKYVSFQSIDEVELVEVAEDELYFEGGESEKSNI